MIEVERKELTNLDVVNEIEKAGGVYVGSSSTWKDDLNKSVEDLEKDSIQLKKDLEEARQDVRQLKRTGVIGHWRDYRKYCANKYYTIEESDASDYMRVKFYRAKEIYGKVFLNLESGSCDDCLYSFIDGYCLGTRADKDTKDMLYWLLRKNYFHEI